MAPMSLPPGFRFHPTDEEIVAYYLDRKITGRTIELEIVPEVDLYKCEPWDLPDKSFLPSKDMEWYFYSPRDKKYPNGSRTNRATRAGYWKATGKDRPVNSQNRPLGMKKTLVYYKGRAPHGIRTNWVMHEYRLIHSFCGTPSSTLKDSYALCRVFKKSVLHSKTKEENMANIADDHHQMDHTVSVSDDQLAIDPEDTMSSKEREGEEDVDDNNFNKEFCKFQPDTSSSDVTQWTPPHYQPGKTIAADHDMQAPLITSLSDEANSSANISSSFGMDFSSNLFQDVQTKMMIPADCSSFHNYQLQQCPPLELEDFPQINIIAKPSKSEIIIDDYNMIYDRYCKDAINGSLDEIFSLCSSDQDNSNALSMHDGY